MAQKEKPSAEKEKVVPDTKKEKKPLASKEKKSISDIIHKKKMDASQDDTQVVEDGQEELEAAENEDEAAASELAESSDADETEEGENDEPADDDEAEEGKPEEQAAAPKKKLSEVETLRAEIAEMGKRHQSQIEALTSAFQLDRSRATSHLVDDAAAPERQLMVENPYLDKVFEDAVKGRFSDYDEVVKDFAAHAATQPELLNQIKALPAAQRFEQLYQAGVMLRYHKKYGTLHLPDLEKKMVEEGKRLAKEESEKLIAEQKKRGLSARSKQPTDTRVARSAGEEDPPDTYRSPESFSRVLKNVFGTA